MSAHDELEPCDAIAADLTEENFQRIAADLTLRMQRAGLIPIRPSTSSTPQPSPRPQPPSRLPLTVKPLQARPRRTGRLLAAATALTVSVGAVVLVTWHIRNQSSAEPLLVPAAHTLVEAPKPNVAQTEPQSLCNDEPAHKTGDAEHDLIVKVPAPQPSPTVPTPVAPSLVQSPPDVAMTSMAFTEYVTKTGDTLSGIADSELKDVKRWPEIWELNRARIPHCDRVPVGLTIRLPSRSISNPDPVGTAVASRFSNEIGTPAAVLPAASRLAKCERPKQATR